MGRYLTLSKLIESRNIPPLGANVGSSIFGCRLGSFDPCRISSEQIRLPQAENCKHGSEERV
jgi:hypothetical protein